MSVSRNHLSVAPVHTTLVDSEAVANFSKASEQFFSRKALAKRWECSVETIKRRTRDGQLHPIRFNARMIRYPLSEIIRAEQEGAEQ